VNPGLATTDGIQRTIVSDLKRYNVRYVVLRDKTWYEPNKSSVSSGVTILHEKIRSDFQPIRRFGVYTIWIKET